ncbi:hypothetical protein CMV_006039 [Castanea mollissima]|uniref:Uncharacterized protein n=1 Tax=Castanea mollissima TaxID=60419 RepID=A0A8J4VTT1_9ROSI|nr:hypothetical protein CMV_006039 [Castanea mollissima]
MVKPGDRSSPALECGHDGSSYLKYPMTIDLLFFSSGFCTPHSKNLNEAAAKPVSATSSGSQSGISLRENGSLMDEAGCLNTDKLSFDANGALKEKKKYEVISET